MLSITDQYSKVIIILIFGMFRGSLQEPGLKYTPMFSNSPQTILFSQLTLIIFEHSVLFF
jgi:hypothetical protein